MTAVQFQRHAFSVTNALFHRPESKCNFATWTYLRVASFHYRLHHRQDGLAALLMSKFLDRQQGEQTTSCAEVFLPRIGKC